MKIPVPSHIQQIRPYVPGKPIDEVERELGLTGTIKMASNESPLGPSPQGHGGREGIPGPAPHLPRGRAGST